MISNATQSAPSEPSPAEAAPACGADRAMLGRLGRGLLLWALVCALPLYQWARFSLDDDVQSYLVLIPFIACYLIWIYREQLPVRSGGASVLSWACWFLAIGLLGAYGLLAFLLPAETAADALTPAIAGFVCGVLALCTRHLDGETLKRIRFPLGFLFLMVPLPGFMIHGIEVLLQHASAEATSWGFSLANVSNLRNGLTFRLPGISIMVAQECSGVRSTLVLLVTSLVAGYLFLKSPGARVVLFLSMVVLGVFRNALRITVISKLCIDIGPHMIDSPIHKRGGPLFFAVSLIPALVLLWFLIRRERRAGNVAGLPPTPPAGSRTS